MNQGNQASSRKFQITNFKFRITILILIIVVLMIIAINPASKNQEKSPSNELIMPDNTEVEVIKSPENMPNVPGTEKNKIDANSPQYGPATIEDLGGDINQPISLEELLKEKEIEIKK